MSEGNQGPNLYETPKCDCGRSEFNKIVELVWKPGSGVVERPAGYSCRQCHKPVIMAALQTRAKQRHLEEQMAELREQQKMNDLSIANESKKKADAVTTVPNKTA